MSAREQLQAAAAEAAAQVLKILGVRVTILHGDTTFANLVGELTALERIADRSSSPYGIVRRAIFHIPKQSGWAGEARPGDVLTWDGGDGDYSIASVKADGLEAIYHITAYYAESPVGLVLE